MDLQANWQYLLIYQITRGAFFMHPRVALGMAAHLEGIIGKANKAEKLSADTMRADFIQMAANSPSDEYSIYDDAPEGSTAIFPLKGSMLKYGTWCDYGTEEIASFMREAIHHKNIGSIVLDIDSGGGSVAAIAPILDVIEESRQAGKPVVAKVDMCCSAAYYAAAACDYIVSDNSISAEIGSIGVMASFWDIVPHYEKEGYKFHKIYATQSTEKNKAFDMALEGKYELIQAELLDPLAIGFQNYVKTMREGKIDLEAPGILSGATFFALESLEYGLIDEIGSRVTAIDRAQQIAESRKFLSNAK